MPGPGGMGGPGPRGMGGPGMGGGHMPPPPPPRRRRYRRGCMPGCLVYVLAMFSIIAVIVLAAVLIF